MKKNPLTRLFTFAVSIFFLLVFLPSTDAAEEKVIFGLVSPLSGPFQDIGERDVHAVKSAVEQINAEGGLLGKKVELLVEDDEFNPAVATRKARKLILEDGAKFIINNTGSHITLALAPIAEKYKVINLTAATEAAKITGSEFTPYTFRACLNTDQHSGAIVAYFAKKYPQYKKYYLLNQDYAFGREAAESFKKKFKQVMPPDAEIIGEVFHPLGLRDFAPYVSTIMASGAEVVLTGDFGTDLRLLLKQGAALGWKIKLGSYFLDDPLITQDVGQAAVGHVTADVYAPTIDSPPNKAFLEKWRARDKDAPLVFKYPNAIMGKIYWAIRFMAEAIKKADSTDAEAVIKAWEGMSFEVPWGTVTMRACDHQLITPAVVAEVEALSDIYDFPYMGRPAIIPAEEITVPPELTGNSRCK